MRLLFLAKRFPQQRDLIERPYGRFCNIPTGLADLGHDVRVELISHRRVGSAELERSGVTWSGRDLLSSGFRRVWRQLVASTRLFRPHWIIGCSDAWFGWLAHRLSREAGVPFAVDAYDNFESYMPWNLPLHRLWRRSVAAASLVTAAGPQLAAYLQAFRQDGEPVRILPMAPDPGFVPLDRESARDALGLPASRPLIGYFGSWSRNRGTEALLHAFEHVRSRLSDSRLVLTGRTPDRVRRLPGVVGLGYLDDADLPSALNAMNVACVITADTSFGRYSYPAKLCEAMACGIPVVATGTGPVRWMAGDDSRFLVAPGDVSELGRRILENMELDRVDYGDLPTWGKAADAMDGMLREQDRRVRG